MTEKNNSYSESLEDYLEAIYLLGGQNVKSIDLAKRLNVSRASVNRAVNTLIDKGLVNKELYGEISLTHKGKSTSSNVLRKHKLLKKFLMDVLKVSPEVAEEEACGIEHNISEDTENKIEELVNKLLDE